MSSEGHGERRVGGGGNRQGQKQPKKPTVRRLAAGKQMPKQIRQKQEVQETRSVPALEQSFTSCDGLRLADLLKGPAGMQWFLSSSSFPASFGARVTRRPSCGQNVHAPPSLAGVRPATGGRELR